ncbi:DEAD/DEAH box helicase [Sulfurimonas sp.]|jgi:SNF2 family DNA or RNA helicase|uniref:DEAD/DEAH box helicase n=1 Tax=Sulfurimonas sp. TaxID=2022749 RepID=UPI0025F3D177|nr:helicase-related protein [Sulfurimonas sp.]MBT5934396.1 DEAD/DEAH box helicase family protein [Sulfurimonas sp.]
MKKAIYLPTNTSIIILNEIDENYVNVFLDGEEKTVSRRDIELKSEAKGISFDAMNAAVFSTLISNPVTDLLYSYNSSRLVPKHYQYRPLIKMLNSPNNRLLIADEVGLGKTIEAGIIYKEIDKRDDVEIALIVVPSSLTLKWRDEMYMRFGEEFEVKKVNEFRAFLKEYDAYSDSKLFTNKIIISYHTLRDEVITSMLQDTLLHIDMLIMDEAHSFRNNETSTFEGAALVTGLSENILFLSATPVQNSIRDLFNILSLLDEDTFLDEDYFLKTIKPNSLIHEVVANLKNGQPLETLKSLIAKKDLKTLHLNQHQEVLFQTFSRENELTQEERVDYIKQFTEADNLSYIINRTKKKDVGMFIPREAVSQTIPGTEEEIAFYEEVVDFVKLLFKYRNPKIPSGFITIMPERMASSCMLASIESFENMRKTKKFFVGDIDDQDDELIDVDLEEFLLAKLDILIAKGKEIGSEDSKYKAFESTIDKLISEDVNKMIVFSFFKKTLAYLEEKLIKKGLRVGKIDGDLTPEERYEKINEFRDDKFDILLSSEVGSEGLDMQFCNVVFNYDLPWNPMRVEQRIGRIDRIGQVAEKLLVFNLCIEGTVEDRILNRLYSKLDIFESSLGELEPILGNIQKTFNVQNMINLSDEELKRKIDLEAQSLIRQKKDVSEQNTAMDAMLNDDYNFDETYEKFANSTKEKFVEVGVENFVLGFLKKNNINYLTMANGVYRLNATEAKELFNTLKPLMADSREKSAYITQKRVLNRLRKSKSFHFTFTKEENHDFSLEYISLSHPFLKLMESKSDEVCYSSVNNNSYSNGYAVVYREEIYAHKKFTTLKTVIVDENLKLVDSLDYYSFASSCNSTSDIAPVDDLEKKKNAIESQIIKQLSISVASKTSETEQLINQKIRVLQEHYEKKKAYAQKMEAKVSNLDVIRMRQAQVENIKQLEEQKVSALKKQMEVSGNYKILGIVELTHG